METISTRQVRYSSGVSKQASSCCHYAAAAVRVSVVLSTMYCSVLSMDGWIVADDLLCCSVPLIIIIFRYRGIVRYEHRSDSRGSACLQSRPTHSDPPTELVAAATGDAAPVVQGR